MQGRHVINSKKKAIVMEGVTRNDLEKLAKQNEMCQDEMNSTLANGYLRCRNAECDEGLGHAK